MAQPFKNCTGRASYKHPVPLYDTTTGVVASFATRAVHLRDQAR
jgi:hypothetical protein